MHFIQAFLAFLLLAAVINELRSALQTLYCQYASFFWSDFDQSVLSFPHVDPLLLSHAQFLAGC